VATIPPDGKPARSDRTQILRDRLASAARLLQKWALWEWLFESHKARALEEREAKLSDGARQYLVRAQVSLDAAERLLQHQSAEANTALLGPTIDLLRQAASWASLALLEQYEGSVTASASRNKLDEAGWAEVSERERVSRKNDLWESWLSRSGETIWDAPPTRVRLSELVDLTTQLVRSSKKVSLEREAIWFRRTYRIGFPLLLIIAAAAFVGYSRHRAAALEETAYLWTVSSGAGDTSTSTQLAH
jgi:hypothetical protein